MNSTVVKTSLILSLVAGLPATQILAAPQADEQANEESVEQSWQEALQVQVELAKAKVSLLQARTELWLEQNSEKAQHSLDEASASLNKAAHHADDVTAARITRLKSQIKRGGQLLRDKSKQAETELHVLADQSEVTLNAALAHAQTSNKTVQDEIATRYALAQANTAALRARIALEIDQSSEQAQLALQDAEKYLQQAKSSTSEAVVEQIEQLESDVRAAQREVREQSTEAESRIRKLALATQKRVQAYRETIRESEETRLLKKRYAQLEAKAALLKANLAARTDATADQVTAYLDESRAWYDSMKSHVSEHWGEELADMSVQIDEAKQAVERKDKQTRAKLAELLKRAANILRDDKHDKGGKENEND